MLRRIDSHPQSVFLTFDDGPDPVGTPAVLEVLRRHDARATFFVIGEKARAHPDLLRAIVADGHAIGNHSPDHRFRNFWRRTPNVTEWIRRADQDLRSVGISSVGFRPPAGIITPHVLRAARALDQPLILWSERFFDAVFRWRESRARRSAARLKGGSIVLLHDRQSSTRIGEFCRTLDTYLDCLKERGLRFEALSRSITSEPTT